MSVISENLSSVANPSKATPVPARSSAIARGRQATRERLLEGGRQLFAERGLHGVTAHDIAHRVELASGTFYLHFKNKQELFREIAVTSVNDLIERLQQAWEPFSDSQDRPAMVTAQSEALMCFAEENRDMIRVLFSPDSGAAAIGSDILQRLAATIAEGRRELIAAGGNTDDIDPEVLGQAKVGMWAQVLSWWAADPSRVTRESLIKTLTQIQLSGTEAVSPKET